MRRRMLLLAAVAVLFAGAKWSAAQDLRVILQWPTGHKLNRHNLGHGPGYKPYGWGYIPRSRETSSPYPYFGHPHFQRPHYRGPNYHGRWSPYPDFGPYRGNADPLHVGRPYPDPDQTETVVQP